MIWTKQNHDLYHRQSTINFGEWAILALLLCLCIGSASFYISVTNTFSKIISYDRKIQNEIEVLKSEGEAIVEHMMRLVSQQEQFIQRQNAIIQNLMSQAEVTFTDLEMIQTGDTTPYLKLLLVTTPLKSLDKLHEVSYSEEYARRRIETIVRELWNFINDQLLNIEDMLFERTDRKTEKEKRMIEFFEKNGNLELQPDMFNKEENYLEKEKDNYLENKIIPTHVTKVTKDEKNISNKEGTFTKKVIAPLEKGSTMLENGVSNVQGVPVFMKRSVLNVEDIASLKERPVSRTERIIFKSKSSASFDQRVVAKINNTTTKERNTSSLEDINKGETTFSSGKPSAESTYLKENKMGDNYKNPTQFEAPITPLKKTALQTKLKMFSQELNGYRRALLDAFDLFKKADHADSYRSIMSKRLGKLVQDRLELLQNPKKCEKKRIIGCRQKVCGFGCNVHHFMYCLVTAYATNKTLVIDAPAAWKTLFKPLSNSCKHVIEAKVLKESEHNQATQLEYFQDRHKIHNTTLQESTGNTTYDEDIDFLPLIEDVYTKSREYLPLTIPQDLAHEIAIFHGNPAAWWLGQTASYIFRPTSTFEEHLRTEKQSLNYEKPIVGVHVRRTDKLPIEADYHSLEEYMVHVADYYDQLQRSNPQIIRRVYLATDDVDILPEALLSYPNYTFVSNQSAARVGVDERDLPDAMMGIATDIYFLSRSDLLVCTFSSQVCRLAYELMQTLHADASQMFRSLDDIYYFGGQNDHHMIAVESHTPDEYCNDTMDLQKGDKIMVAGNHWNGFSKGYNMRSMQYGLYPSYKVEDHISKYPMPLYSKIH